jgi:hypothetical protein
MKAIIAALFLAVLPAAGLAAVDGRNIPADFCPGGLPGCQALLELQDNHTGFGDARPPTGGYVPGSELNQLYVFKTADSLAINVTGNLETNGNAFVVLLDVIPGGQGTLNVSVGPGSVRGLTGLKLDPGFLPDYAIAVNTAGNVYVDLVNLNAGTSRYLGFVPLNSGGVLGGAGSSNPNGSRMGFNNTNSAGVIGNPPPHKTAEEHMADAATALNGMELMLSLADIGVDVSLSEVRILVLLCGGSGYLSNQFLPGIGAGTQKGNLGFPPKDLTDDNIAPGLQYAVVDVSAIRQPAGPIDGLNIPQDSGSATLVATQNNYTGFGNASGTGTAGSNGSELDALFMRSTSTGLDIGITGNLEPNGNYILLFLDTSDGGVGPTGLNVPEGVGPQSQVLQRMNGTIFDEGFSPTHVVMVDANSAETFPGSGEYRQYAYLHIVDLRTNTSRYIGRVEVGAGAPLLEQGDNPNGILMGLDNTNQDGVTADNNRTPEQNRTDAATATTGLELSIPYADIGLGRPVIRYLAVLTGNSGYFSNQFLPGLGGGFLNFGDPPLNMNTIPRAQFGEFAVTGIVYPPVASVAEWKASPDGTPGELMSTVSAVFAERDEFYVQDSWPKNISGVRVLAPAFGLEIGDTVRVKGLMTRSGGERSVAASEVVKTGIGQPPSPLFAAQRALGGGPSGYTPGVSGGAGANNTGILMRSAGRVTRFGLDEDGTFFIYLDDGSGLFDGNEWGTKGVRVNLPPGGPLPMEESTVDVTGVCSILQRDGISHPLLKSRQAADVRQVD